MMFFTWLIALAALAVLTLILGLSLWLTSRERHDQIKPTEVTSGPKTTGHIEQPRAA